MDNVIDRNFIKLTFIGDIMCELPLLKAAHTKKGYDFDSVFVGTTDLFNSADYVVGNLETVFGGKSVGYTRSLYSFNTPDSFLDSLKRAGIDMCVTANNHCLDRGLDGLKRTLYELDKRGISHIGTYLSKEASDQIFVKDIKGFKIAFLAYTYGTGIKDNHVELPDDFSYSVNLLIPQKIGSPIKYSKVEGEVPYIKQFISRLISEKKKLQLKKMLKKPVGVPRMDSMWDELIDEKLLEILKSNIGKAKKQADYVILNIHNGGQFNSMPGDFSEYIMNFCVESGADLVVGHHPHVVQKASFIANKLCAFSLGNYSISPSTPYMLFENLPQYSIALHVYIGKHFLIHYSFSILKIVENRKGNLTIYDTYDLFQKCNEYNRMSLFKNIREIYCRFSQNSGENFNVKKEYRLYEQ